ncbi:unnamed protein product [Prunus armeniaca]
MERPVTRYRDRGPVQARRLEECLVSVMQIGLSCSAISQGERMRMDVVVNKMKTISQFKKKLAIHQIVQNKGIILHSVYALLIALLNYN